MKFFTLILAASSLLFASLDALTSYQAHFIQKVVDQEKSTITYEGSFKAKKPHWAVWHYEKPIPKSVFLIRDEATIIEPELEQVIRKKTRAEFSLFKLIKEAKKTAPNRYETVIDEIVYTLTAEGNILKTLSYRDGFENEVTIYFSQCLPDAPLSTQDFAVVFPEDFDIITE